jgi:hypothetical protein
MYLPHGSWGFGVLVQDRQTLGLRVVVVPNGREALRVLDGVAEANADRVWAARVAEIADPPLAPTEWVVPIGEFMGAAVQSEPTAAELLCPACRSPLFWQATGIS